MEIISQVAFALQTVLTTVSDAAAEISGFIERKRKLTGALFVQTVVFTWLSNAEATYSQFSQTAGTLGLEISPQAIEQRFDQKAAEMLKIVLDSTVEKMVAAEPKALPLLERFDEVFIDDSSWISLPPELVHLYRGSGTKTEKNMSSTKLQLRWELASGGLVHLFLTDGTTNDCRAAQQFVPVAGGSLKLSDLGYFSLDEFAQSSEDGVFWLTRIKANCEVLDCHGNRLDLAAYLAKQWIDEIDLPILLGVQAQLPARLVAQRVPASVAAKRRREMKKNAKKKGRTPSDKRLSLAEWNLLATNVSQELLTVNEAMILSRVRWQIELMFKLWKSHGQIDTSTSNKPWRILCELYAKLIAMVIQHWVLLISPWRAPEQSLYKAAKAVASHSMNLAVAFYLNGLNHLVIALSSIKRALGCGCRIYKRRDQPSTYQLLLQASDDSQVFS